MSNNIINPTLPNTYTHCIDDAIIYLGNGVTWSQLAIQPHDHPITKSLGNQLENGLAFTEKQSVIAERLVKKYSGILKDYGFDVDKILQEKIYKQPFRTIDKTKILYVDGENIVCKSPFIPDLVNAFKKRKKTSYEKGEYQPDSKEWSFDYNEPNVDFLIKNTKGKDFSINNDIINCYEKISKVFKEGLRYYPILKYDTKFFVENLNVSEEDKKELENITSVRKAIFWARKRGCLVYDDSVVDQFDNVTDYDKLSMGDLQTKVIDFRKYPFTDLVNIINATNTTIILVHSNDVEQLKNWIVKLKDNGVSAEDIAVCFRYKKDAEGNSFIKEEQVNEYSPNKKVLITNERIPKPFIKDKIDPDLIIVDLPVQPSHYKTQIYLDNKSLVMYNNTSIMNRNV